MERKVMKRIIGSIRPLWLPVIVALAVVLPQSAPAAPSIMTFESLAWSSGTGAYGFPDGYTYSTSDYTESGFTISPSSGTGFCLIAQDNPNLFMGSTGLSNCNANGINILTKVGGGTFSLSFIDLAPFGRFLDPVSPYGGGALVTFVGTKADASTVSVTFTTPPDAAPFPAYAFQTYSFSGLGFDNLVSVSWTHVSPYHQFDNITLDAAPLDTDDDGITDNEDDCPDSDLSTTVVIDGCNSGVTNTLFSSDGCTISDLIADCATSASDHGQFVSCVSGLTNALKKSGIITGEQKGAIQSCAAQADIP
jgi:hypothetical protein